MTNIHEIKLLSVSVSNVYTIHAHFKCWYKILPKCLKKDLMKYFIHIYTDGSKGGCKVGYAVYLKWDYNNVSSFTAEA